MRSYFAASLLGHIALMVIWAVVGPTLVPPPPALNAMDVSMVTPDQLPTVDEPVNTPPPEIERPETPVEVDELPPAEVEPLPEPEVPESELPPPPPPDEIVRPQRDLTPDPAPEEPEQPVEQLELGLPDPDLPPPPPIEDLPEPEPVQRAARVDSSSTEVAAPTPEVAVAEEPSEQVSEAIDANREVGVQSDSGIDDGYLMRVQRKIGRRWQPTPASALGKPRVVTVVTFQIRADGQVASPRVSEPSGLSVFDRQALRAVIDASPLPALPPRFGDGISINFRFEYVR